MKLPPKTSVLLLALPLLLVGCSSKPDDPETATRKDELLQLHDIYAMYVKKNGQPPKQLSDINRPEYTTSNPGIVGALQTGRYSVVWGMDLNANGGAVVAYEKDAPSQGGWVITADGKPRQMSADQVQAAIKK